MCHVSVQCHNLWACIYIKKQDSPTICSDRNSTESFRIRIRIRINSIDKGKE